MRMSACWLFSVLWGAKGAGREAAELSRELLSELYQPRRRMAFFKDFPAEDQRACQLYDKIFVEYRANPGALVNIRYQITDGKDRAADDHGAYDTGL